MCEPEHASADLLPEKPRLAAATSALFDSASTKKCPYKDPMHRAKTAFFTNSLQERISPETACRLTPKRVLQVPNAISDAKVPKKVVAQPKPVRYIRGQRPRAVRAPCVHPLCQQAWHPEWDAQAERQLRYIRTTRLALEAAQSAPL